MEINQVKGEKHSSQRGQHVQRPRDGELPQLHETDKEGGVGGQRAKAGSSEAAREAEV